uniref:Transcriptional adapter 1 n=1 Tax=Cherax quadricarinatus TaxID=27406 RepID=G0ZJ97_CHEQU|nr:transcriptional adapter 1 [Cherax quadricarinatus]
MTGHQRVWDYPLARAVKQETAPLGPLLTLPSRMLLIWLHVLLKQIILFHQLLVWIF